MKSRGIFITFEGPEGGGKSTHIALLAKAAEAQGYTILVTREPGGTTFSQELRKILLHPDSKLTPLTELFLYEADRAQHIEDVIIPALLKGTVVLCDRYTDSTLAYQGDGRGLEVKQIQTLNNIASHGLVPDLTVVIDVDVQKGLANAHAKKKGHDRLENAGLDFHERVRKGFLRLAEEDPKRFRLIHQQETIAETQQLIQQVVFRFITREARGEK